MQEEIRQRATVYTQESLDTNTTRDRQNELRNFYKFLIIHVASYLGIKHNGIYSDNLLRETVNKCVSLFKNASFSIWTFYVHFFLRLYLFIISNILYFLDEKILVSQINKKVSSNFVLTF